MTANSERAEAIRRIQDEMADYGLTMEELETAGCFKPSPRPLRRRRSATANAEGLAWDGQGEMPDWLRRAVNAAQSGEFFRVNSQLPGMLRDYIHRRTKRFRALTGQDQQGRSTEYHGNHREESRNHELRKIIGALRDVRARKAAVLQGPTQERENRRQSRYVIQGGARGPPKSKEGCPNG